jgi:2,4-dienoyl-CoA reductase-like NADH-dependent reductase (Old Yellow Enzyme family)/thioredoxin reductase
VGIIITEATCVDSSVGRLAPRQNLIDSDKFIPGLRKLAEAIQLPGAKAMLQLFHAGRRASSLITGRQPVAPSPIPNHWGDRPRELTVPEIAEIVTHFADGAERALKAGFDGVEIHAAHSYLISQFLSPLYNQRRDAYGGSIQNRARLLVEIIAAIRERVGSDYPVWCRISGAEYAVSGQITLAKGGITLDETLDVARLAEEAGVDALHISASHIGRVRMHPMAWPPGVMVPLVEGIKDVVSIPVIAVGRIPPELGEQVLQEGKADLIAMGRALIADPHLPRKLESGRPEDVIPCIYCWMCLETVDRKEGACCPVNAAFGKERAYQLKPAAAPKRVVVVGGGPGGMEAARVAAQRGHQVTLFEEGEALGGQVLLASQPQVYRDTLDTYRRYLAEQVAKQRVELRLRERFTADMLDDLKPDAVVLATGMRPTIPEIPGADGRHVYFASAVLAGAETGARVAVIGGEALGCATALHLAEQGKQVTIVSRGTRLVPQLGPSMGDALISDLTARGVAMLTGVEYEEITSAGVVVKTRQAERRIIAADTVVLAVGARPNTELLSAIEAKVPQVFRVGDCNEPGGIKEAVDDGYRIGLSL